MRRNITRTATQAAKAARQSPSVAERIMWEVLRRKTTGFKFRREHPIGPYRIDFYCPEALLAVEMDGDQHDPQRDMIRDRFLAEKGIFTYRISNREFFGIDSPCLKDEVSEIIRICQERTMRPSS